MKTDSVSAHQQLLNILKKKDKTDFSSQEKNELKENDDSFQNGLKAALEENKPLEELKISQHAAKRIEDRRLQFDNEEFVKLKQAVEKLRNKGGHDSLIITNKAAYIVDVDNNKVVTAMDKANLEENVFTKIDSTLFVN